MRLFEPRVTALETSWMLDALRKAMNQSLIVKDKLGRTYGRILYFSFLGIEQEIVTKWPWNRSPGVMLVDFWGVFQAGAVGNGPGPNFGRKPTQHQN